VQVVPKNVSEDQKLARN